MGGKRNGGTRSRVPGGAITSGEGRKARVRAFLFSLFFLERWRKLCGGGGGEFQFLTGKNSKRDGRGTVSSPLL